MPVTDVISGELHHGHQVSGMWSYFGKIFYVLLSGYLSSTRPALQFLEQRWKVELYFSFLVTLLAVFLVVSCYIFAQTSNGNLHKPFSLRGFFKTYFDLFAVSRLTQQHGQKFKTLKAFYLWCQLCWLDHQCPHVQDSQALILFRDLPGLGYRKLGQSDVWNTNICPNKRASKINRI